MCRSDKALCRLGELSRRDLHPLGPDARHPCAVRTAENLAATLARFWPGGELEVTAHASFRLAGDAPCRYAIWPIARRRWHLEEWAAHAPLQEKPGRPEFPCPPGGALPRGAHEP